MTNLYEATEIFGSVRRAQGAGVIVIRIDVQALAPGESREQTPMHPLTPPMRLRSIEVVHVSTGDPDPGVFHRRRNTKGSRRKGRLASQAWAIMRLRMREAPHLFLPSATLDQVRIGALDHQLTPIPISFLQRQELARYGAPGSWFDVVVRAPEIFRVTLTNHDCRPMSIMLAAWGQELNTHVKTRVIQGP